MDMCYKCGAILGYNGCYECQRITCYYCGKRAEGEEVIKGQYRSRCETSVCLGRTLSKEEKISVPEYNPRGKNEGK